MANESKTVNGIVYEEIDHKKYKYKLTKDYSIQTKIRPKSGRAAVSGRVLLNRGGLLTIHAGYAWDGADCIPDLPYVMRGSLVHDALYQLIREETGNTGTWLQSDQKCPADKLFCELCVEDGMWRWVAWVIYRLLCVFGSPGRPST